MRDGSHTTRRRLLAACAGLAGVGTAGCQGDSPFSWGTGTATRTKAPADGGAPATDTPGGTDGTTVEDFEGPVRSWHANTGVGTGSGVQSDVVRAGTGALELVNIGGPGYDGSYTSLPGDGLGAYPEFGDTVSVWTRSDGGDGPNLGLCYNWQDRGSYTQSDGSGYAARIKIDEDVVEFAKVVDGSSTVTTPAQTSTPLGLGTWYRITVETTVEGSHRITLHDGSGGELARVSTQDTEWPSGGYGVAYSGNNTDGESSYWDELTLQS